MNTAELENYNKIHNGATGFFEQKRGLIEVSGKEAIQFLNGLITNDVAKLTENAQMSAAFPNAQGRLLAFVRVLKKDDKFFFETETATHEKVFNNLFRFTFAGDFFVADLSEKYTYFSIENGKRKMENADFVKNVGFIEFQTNSGADFFIPHDAAENFKEQLTNQNAVEISDELFEVLRIENGVPKYGVDMDETTIVPEIGDEAISYNKGCYIGQEIIARIHFRGHIAKKITGLVIEDESFSVAPNAEIKSSDGKNAGKTTSVTFSPKLNKTIALGFIRYDFLAENTRLKIGEATAIVTNLPIINGRG